MCLADLITLCADCLDILGASASWKHKSLSEPVQGKLYLYLLLTTLPTAKIVLHSVDGR